MYDDDLYVTLFFFNDTATTEIYTLSLHDALPISPVADCVPVRIDGSRPSAGIRPSPVTTRRRARVHAEEADDLLGQAQERLRSEEHTSELQSPCNLVCRLLLEKKKNNSNSRTNIA